MPAAACHIVECGTLTETLILRYRVNLQYYGTHIVYDGEGGVLCGLYGRQDLQGQGRLLELCVRALRARVEEPYDLLFPLPARPLLAMRTAAAGAAERGRGGCTL